MTDPADGTEGATSAGPIVPRPGDIEWPDGVEPQFGAGPLDELVLAGGGAVDPVDEPGAGAGPDPLTGAPAPVAGGGGIRVGDRFGDGGSGKDGAGDGASGTADPAVDDSAVDDPGSADAGSADAGPADAGPDDAGPDDAGSDDPVDAGFDEALGRAPDIAIGADRFGGVEVDTAAATPGAQELGIA